MPRHSDPARKYHAAITLLAESAERDRANGLAAILESAACAISLGLVRDLSAVCMQFWQERGQTIAEVAPSEASAHPPKRGRRTDAPARSARSTKKARVARR